MLFPSHQIDVDRVLNIALQRITYAESITTCSPPFGKVIFMKGDAVENSETPDQSLVPGRIDVVDPPEISPHCC